MIVIPQHRQAIDPMKMPYDISHQWTIRAGRSISQNRKTPILLPEGC